jgi:hypothetical protein
LNCRGQLASHGVEFTKNEQRTQALIKCRVSSILETVN